MVVRYLHIVALVLSLLSLMAASSCSHVEAEEPVGMELVVSANAATKGFVEGESLLNSDGTDRKLVMSCWLRAYDGASYNFFYDEAFSFVDGGWHADPPIYVPFYSSFDLLGYSASKQMAQTDVIWGTPKQVERMRFSLGYDQNQDDVLYGAAYGIASSGASTIYMEMYHSQVWIEAHVRLKEGASSDKDVRINAVTAVNTYGCADISVEANDGIPTATTDLRHYYASDLLLAAAVGGYGQEVTSQDMVFRILVPQQLQTALKVDYTVMGFPFTSMIDFSYARATWLMGMRYIYDVLFDPVTETFVLGFVSVCPWEGGVRYEEWI